MFMIPGFYDGDCLCYRAWWPIHYAVQQQILGLDHLRVAPPQLYGRTYINGTRSTSMFAYGFVPATLRTNCGGKRSSVMISARSKSIRRC